MSDSGRLAQERAEKLLEEAREVSKLCRAQARRPFVLELAGTPKAGKSTPLGVLRDFLEHAGFEVSVMKERAAECPVAMKGHFFFNTSAAKSRTTRRRPSNASC